MTSTIEDNRCKLLVLDLDTNQMKTSDLHSYFKTYGPIEWIELLSNLAAAVIQFTSYLVVDRLMQSPTCLIGQTRVRVRRFRFDRSDCHMDSYTLLVAATPTSSSTNPFTEALLHQCFHQYQSRITSVEVISGNQALISFRTYDDVDQILLMPASAFTIHGEQLVAQRIIARINRKSRWDQPSLPLANAPVLSIRNPLMHKLLSHIEYLTKRLREQAAHGREDAHRLEAEVFILKNENALLKSKETVEPKKTVPRRALALADISNQSENRNNQQQRRERSPSKEKQAKRRRAGQISDENSFSR